MKPDYVTKDGYFKISNQEVNKAFNDKMRKEGDYTPTNWKSITRRLGFETGTNRKQMRVRVDDDEMKVRQCFIYTSRPLKKLGIKEQDLNEQFKNEETNE